MNLKDANKANLIDTTTLMAIACAKDNAFTWNRMPLEKRMLWLQYAETVVNVICTTDEPRFTLYDYLDASVNANGIPWEDTAKQVIGLVNRDEHEKAGEIIMKLADNARRAYKD